MVDLPKEKWINWVALTTTILAVCASLASLRSGSYSTRTTLHTTMETNAWSYFQAKSIKQHTLQNQLDLFEVMAARETDPAARAAIEKKAESYKADIARYDKEKADIKQEAESLGAKEGVYKLQAGNFGMSAMLLQIAIMMSSIGALVKLRRLWYLGMCVGVVGLFYMVNGFFLFTSLLL
jgi:hypothetical protein